MGYNTDFTGELKFAKELSAKELAKLKTFLGEDARQHPEWMPGDITHIDLEFTDEFDGLCWNGTEKTYRMVEAINMITRVMRETYPDFKLTGKLFAQGEDFKDRWVLVMDEDGTATAQKVALNGKVVTCPHCEEDFLVE